MLMFREFRIPPTIYGAPWDWEWACVSSKFRIRFFIYKFCLSKAEIICCTLDMKSFFLSRVCFACIRFLSFLWTLQKC